MRAVVTRVRRARITVNDAVIAEISSGLLVLLGVTHTDTAVVADTLARKTYELRILDGERSARDVAAPVLVVSQFTLYADTRRGRRPSWAAAAPREIAEQLVDDYVTALRAQGAQVQTGQFGAHMLVESVNDGPVTLILDA